MDEEKQLQPAQKHRASLLRLLLPVDIILVIITLFTSLFIIIESILSSHGIILNFSNYGHSMDPTIKGNALVIINTAAPFEELKIGDVVMFKEPKGLSTDTDKIRVHISKVDENGNAIDSSSSSSTGTEPETNTIDEMENIEYLEDRAVLHRIVEIKNISTGNRLLLTQGDHNPAPDRYPISAEAYIAKMLWHVDYIGEIIRVLYQNFMVIMVVTILLSICTALINRSVGSLRDR